MTSTTDIIDTIDHRLRQLREEIATLTAARAALDHQDAPTIQPGRRQGSGTDARQSARDPTRPARRQARRAVEVVPAGRLELLLSENGGMTTAALAQRANGSPDQVLTLLRELEAAGRVRRTGQRRGTRWHVITDEERIEQRAAELAARSRAAV